MELNCPECQVANRFDAERAARKSRFKCASCQAVFEVAVVEGVLQPVLARASSGLVPFTPPASPRAAFEDVLDIFDPPESLGQEPDAAPQPQDFEDLLAVPPPAAEEDMPLELSAAPSAGPFAELVETPAEVVAEPVEALAVRAEPAEPFVESSAPAPVQPAAAAPAPAKPVYDKYAVGMRVLRVSPMWLLVSSVGFFAVLLTLSWISKPVGPVGEAVAAGAKLPNTATSPAAKEVPAAPVAMVETVKSDAEKALAPAPPQAAKPAAEAPRPEAARPAAQDFGAGAGGGRFTLQVGSFSNPSEANERVSQLRAAGYAARAVAAELPGRGTWYRVQAGRYGSREEAATAAAQMRSKGAASAAMVTEVN